MAQIDKILYQQFLDSVRLLGGFDSVVWHPDQGALIQGRAMLDGESHYLPRDNNFARELYKSGNGQGARKRKDKLPPAVTLSGDKIVQVYGTNHEDITEKFYQGPETVYSTETMNIKPSYTNVDGSAVKLPSLVNKLTEINRYSDEKAVSKEPFVMTGSGQRDKAQPKVKHGTKPVKLKAGAELYSNKKRPSIMDNMILSRKSSHLSDDEFHSQSNANTRNMLQLSLPDSFGLDGMMIGGQGQDSGFGIGMIGPRRAAKLPPDGKLRSMFVAGKTTIELQRPPAQSPRQSSYLIRKQYNEKLEREQMSKKKIEQQRKGSNDPEWIRKRFKIDSDTFYSSGSEYESDSSELNNTLSLSRKREKLMRFASTDVLLGSGNWEADSESDLETVLKGDEVFTRRTRNKMKKKRMRQFERYLTMLSDPENSETEDQIQISALSDKELQTIRSKVNERKFIKKKHEARARFKRVGLVVLACNRFRSGLHKKTVSKIEPEKTKTKPKKKKEKLGKRVTFDPKVKATTPGSESTMSEERIIKLSPKERFIVEFGWMLTDLGVEVPRGNVTEVVNSTQEERAASTEAPSMLGVFAKAGADSSTAGEKALSAISHAPRSTQTLVETSSRRGFERLTPVGNKNRRSSLPSLKKPSYLLFKVMAKPVSKKGRRKNMKKPKPKCAINNDADLHGEKNKSGCIHNHGDVNSETKRTGARAPIDDDTIFEEVRLELGDLRRSTSTGDIPNEPVDIDLREVIKDIDFPAKEIKLQIIERRRRRQRKKRIARMHAVEATATKTRHEQEYARKVEQRMMPPESSEDEESTNRNIKVHLRPKDTPFVTTGVAWNQKDKPRLESPSQEDIDKQLPGLSRLFLEMRDCKYIRWSHTDQKIIARLREVELV